MAASKRKADDQLAEDKEVPPKLLKLGADDIPICVVCHEELYEDIWQCAEGHLTCGPCREKIGPDNKCPVCQIAPVATSRNRALEKMMAHIERKCPNGCGNFAGSEKEHLAKCELFPYTCQLDGCGKSNVHFPRDKYPEFMAHVVEKHNAVRFDGGAPWRFNTKLQGKDLRGNSERLGAAVFVDEKAALEITALLRWDTSMVEHNWNLIMIVLSGKVGSAFWSLCAHLAFWVTEPAHVEQDMHSRATRRFLNNGMLSNDDVHQE